MARPKHPLNHLMFVDGKATKEYRAWNAMRHRSYKVFVDDRFTDKDNGFQAFLDDVGFCPDPSLELDRKDNDKGYEPGNLRWTTRKENLANRSNTLIVINYDGSKEPLSKFCERTGQNPLRLKQRFGIRKVRILHASELA